MLRVTCVCLFLSDVSSLLDPVKYMGTATLTCCNLAIDSYKVCNLKVYVLNFKLKHSYEYIVFFEHTHTL